MGVKTHNSTIIDHILTNSFDSKIETEILKVDILDHFSAFFTSKSMNVKTNQDNLPNASKSYMKNF